MREAVLAWMRAERKGAVEAAKHFGLNPNTVKAWDTRSRKGNAAPPARQANGPPTRHSNGDRIREPMRLESFTPAARNDLRTGFEAARGICRVAARMIARYELVELERDRQRALGVPDDCLPELPELPDPRALVAANRAMKLALEIAPGLATFDDSTTEAESKVAPMTAKELAAAVAERMRDPAAAGAAPSVPALRVVK